MNPDLAKLQAYPFEKLAKLNAGTNPPRGLEPISLAIGEPKHATPGFIGEALLAHLHGLATYPTTRGTRSLRESIARWASQRFHLPEDRLDPERQILPVNGTREALFSFAQALIDRSRDALVMMPNPFYQIYEGAALLAGAETHFVPCSEGNAFLPDFSAVTPTEWERCQLLYLCSPGNPTGAVIDLSTLQHLIELAAKYDFVIAADECYSEIYLDEAQPPPGLLQAAEAMGNSEFSRCVVFHSLSKRSNAPGLRSGFVAGDASLIQPYFRYRTYHGCAMPLQTQAASALAWGDEHHVRENRALYRRKFAAVLEILAGTLQVQYPRASFYLWPSTPQPDADFARGLLQQQNVAVLPGSFLSRRTGSGDPGANRVRMALVAPLEQCVEAAKRIRTYTESL